jgi:hypothetical protein
MIAEFADFVTGGSYDPTVIDAADYDGFAGGLGIVALFNRCVERIHVHMQNSATHTVYLVTVTVIFFENTGGL